MLYSILILSHGRGYSLIFSDSYELLVSILQRDNHIMSGFFWRNIHCSTWASCTTCLFVLKIAFEKLRGSKSWLARTLLHWCKMASFAENGCFPEITCRATQVEDFRKLGLTQQRLKWEKLRYFTEILVVGSHEIVVGFRDT